MLLLIWDLWFSLSRLILYYFIKSSFIFVSNVLLFFYSFIISLILLNFFFSYGGFISASTSGKISFPFLTRIFFFFSIRALSISVSYLFISIPYICNLSCFSMSSLSLNSSSFLRKKLMLFLLWSSFWMVSCS